MLRGWRRFVLPIGLAVAFVVCLGPIFNPDLGWHLTAARRIVQAGAIPRVDFLSWSKAGEPWIDFEWGAQLIFYGLERLGGLWALWLFKTATYFALPLALVWLLRLWKLPDVWIGCALMPFSLALFPVCDIRPEIFSLLFFVAQLHILERRRLGLLTRRPTAFLAAHAAFYALWANLHAGFPTGLALCAVYGVAECWGRRRRPGADSPLAWATAGALGTLCNPYGPRVYAIFLDHWKYRGLLSQLVLEWEAPNFMNTYMSGYWILILFSFLGVMLVLARDMALPREHLAAFAVFGLMSSRAFRTTSYTALLVFPIGLAAWRRLRSPPWWKRVRAGVLVLGAAAAVARTAQIARQQRFDRPLAVLGSYGPSRACDFLLREKSALGGLRLYNPWNWGGYLDYRLYPEYQVYMDGRYLFTEFLEGLERAGQQPGSWRKYLDDKGIDLAMLYNDGRVIRLGTATYWRPFTVHAMPRVDWALVYWDAQTVVLARRAKVPAGWLKAHEFRVLRPHDLRFIGILIAAGAVSLADVEAEIDRYEKEIGDPLELARMRLWIAEVKKGLAAVDAVKTSRASRVPAVQTGRAGAAGLK